VGGGGEGVESAYDLGVNVQISVCACVCVCVCVFVCVQVCTTYRTACLLPVSLLLLL